MLDAALSDGAGKAPDSGAAEAIRRAPPALALALASLALGGCAALGLSSDGAAPLPDEDPPPELAQREEEEPFVVPGIDGPAGEGTDDDGSDAAMAQPGVLASVARFVEDTQRSASERFGAFMYGLDDFFAGDSQSDEPNTSFMRVRLDARKPPLDDFELDPSVKLRVVLPRSEQRLRLLFSTDDEEGENTDGVSEVSSLAADERSLSLALRFVRRARDSSRLDFDLGTRQREGRLQLFGRVNAGYKESIGKRTRVQLSNRYLYYSTSGFEDRLRIDVTHELNETGSRVLRSSSSADWRNGRKGAILGQVFGAYADLDARSAIALEARASYHTSLNDEVRDRYQGHELRVRYRRNVWRPWLYYEFWPAVTWPAELDYRRTWNGLLRLEVTIGAEVAAPAR